MQDLFPVPELRSQGAIRQADGSVQWCVWAPLDDQPELITFCDGLRQQHKMEAAGNGYCVLRLPPSHVPEGTRYLYRLSDGSELPDPASRWQPDGVHKSSGIFEPRRYAGTDRNWRGVPKDELIIYELHVGTFTATGTFEAVIPRLPDLVELGITAMEIMPVAQFPGKRGWGYDGVHPYAAQNTYGGPRGLQRLVDAAHQHGLAVLLDVVYNHLGPEGNYLSRFGPYFTDRHRTPWGPAVNYDGPFSDPVRRFVIDNACYWVREFHMDGLRLDAVQTIFDLSPRHILDEIQEHVQAIAQHEQRLVHVIAESNQNDSRLILSRDRGGYALDGVWADDFHHCVHTALTGETEGYYQDFGHPGHLAKAFREPFVYDGCYSPFQRRRHGSRSERLDREQFVVCVQNHDQIGNRMLGERFGVLLEHAAQRLAAGLLLVSPYTPLLFMGEEYGETRPFPFFCSFFDSDLVKAIREGRRKEFEESDFRWDGEPPDPQSELTFASAILSWAWPEGSHQAGLRQLYRDLLTARRRWPPLKKHLSPKPRLVSHGGSSDDDPSDVLLLAYPDESRYQVCANLAPNSVPRPEPPPPDTVLLCSSANRCYGGQRDDTTSLEILLNQELQIFGPQEWRR
jgi:maltooligosyltrehalose trehalohydrolase